MEETNYRTEVVDGIQIIDYSKGKNIHIRFNYLGEPTEENPNGSYEDGGHLEFKFKDPRDILNFLTRNLELLGPVESSTLFNYVSSNINEGIYSQLDIYHILLLEMKLSLLDCFVAKYELPKKDLEDFTEEELELYKSNCMQFRDTFNASIREAHKFAVANTWKIWNSIQVNPSSILKNPVEVSDSEKELFDTKYKNKEVKVSLAFNLYRRLWQVYFEDNSWVIAGDYGNGWYIAETNFNSYKLI